jgi:hypothetical protein
MLIYVVEKYIITVYGSELKNQGIRNEEMDMNNQLQEVLNELKQIKNKLNELESIKHKMNEIEEMKSQLSIIDEMQHKINQFDKWKSLITQSHDQISLHSLHNTMDTKVSVNSDVNRPSQFNQTDIEAVLLELVYKLQILDSFQMTFLRELHILKLDIVKEVKTVDSSIQSMQSPHVTSVTSLQP